MATKENNELAVVEKEISPIVKKADALTITDEKSLSEATVLLSELNKRGDAIEAEKMKVMRPLLDATAAERKRWKPFESVIEDAVSLVRRKMTNYKTEADRIAEEKAAKIADRVGKGTGNLKAETAARQIDEIEKAPDTVMTEAGSVKFRAQKNYEVQDITKVPFEYLTVNTVAVNKAMKEGIELPGIRYFTEQIPVNSR